MREIKAICVDFPAKDVLAGTAVLPHLSTQEYPLQDWRDARDAVVPDGTIRLAYHLWVEQGQQTATLESWHNVSIQQPGKDDIIVYKSHLERALSTLRNGGMPVVPEGYTPHFEKPEKMYVHYGNDQFGTHLFHPVSNDRHDKPDGGFWASAPDSPTPWIAFAETGFENYPVDKKIEFTVNSAARIFKIDTVDDIAYLAATYPLYDAESELSELGLGSVWIDWNRVAMDFDGISYNYERLGNQMATMDCDCICIFNPEIVRCLDRSQDISQPAPQAEPMELYAIEFYDVRDVAKPEWQASVMQQPMHLYTTDNAFYAVKFSRRTVGASQIEWGKDENAAMYEVAVKCKVTVPAEIAQKIQQRLDLDGQTYITALPITEEMMQNNMEVKFHASTFTYGRMCSLEDASERASEIVALTEFALPQWATLSKDDKEMCEFLHATQAFESAYGSMGFVTRGMQPGDPAWQAPLCQIAQQVHESTLPFDAKLRVMKTLDTALTDIEKYQTEKVVRHRYYSIFAEMSSVANQNYNPELGMAISQWQERLKSNPEEFMPGDEPIAIE